MTITPATATSGLVGRERELAAADGAIADVLGGESRVLAVLGETGIGKSALLDALHERAGGRRPAGPRRPRRRARARRAVRARDRRARRPRRHHAPAARRVRRRRPRRRAPLGRRRRRRPGRPRRRRALPLPPRAARPDRDARPRTPRRAAPRRPPLGRRRLARARAAPAPPPRARPPPARLRAAPHGARPPPPARDPRRLRPADLPLPPSPRRVARADRARPRRRPCASASPARPRATRSSCRSWPASPATRAGRSRRPCSPPSGSRSARCRPPRGRCSTAPPWPATRSTRSWPPPRPGLDPAGALAPLDGLVAADLVCATGDGRAFRFRHPLLRRAVYDAAPPAWRLAAHERVAATLATRGAGASVRAFHVEKCARPGDAAAVGAARRGRRRGREHRAGDRRALVRGRRAPAPPRRPHRAGRPARADGGLAGQRRAAAREPRGAARRARPAPLRAHPRAPGRSWPAPRPSSTCSAATATPTGGCWRRSPTRRRSRRATLALEMAAAGFYAGDAAAMRDWAGRAACDAVGQEALRAGAEGLGALGAQRTGDAARGRDAARAARSTGSRGSTTRRSPRG